MPHISLRMPHESQFTPDSVELLPEVPAESLSDPLSKSPSDLLSELVSDPLSESPSDLLSELVLES